MQWYCCILECCKLFIADIANIFVFILYCHVTVLQPMDILNLIGYNYLAQPLLIKHVLVMDCSSQNFTTSSCMCKTAQL